MVTLWSVWQRNRFKEALVSSDFVIRLLMMNALKVKVWGNILSRLSMSVVPIKINKTSRRKK